MKNVKWFIGILLWQVAGFIVTLLVAIPAGNFHHFIHMLILCLTFTNMMGAGGAALVFLYLKWRVSGRRQKITRFSFIFLTFLLLTVISAKVSLWIGGFVCGLDNFVVNRLHLALVIVDFIVLAVISIFALLLALYEKVSDNLENKIRENEKLQRVQIESKLALLQSKINPHFLFNTLNTMLDTVRRDPDQVEKMILNLSDIYRKTLTMPDNALVPLKDELKLVEEYLEIEKMRMGKRLSYIFHVDESLCNLNIPPMILQILVENAIKHGLSPKKDGGEIQIEVREEEDQLILQVSDSGVGISEQKKNEGFGLYSIQQRLKLMYSAARLEIKKLQTGGTCVEVIIPYGT